MESDQKKKAAADLSAYEKELDQELAAEEQKHKNNMAKLEKRKEEMILDKEKKLQVNKQG